MATTDDDRLASTGGTPRSPLAMTRPERMAFLAGPHVGVVVHTGADGVDPAASPVWYCYEPDGDITFVTSARSQKAQRLAEASAMTFLVQQEAPPQRFVAAHGTARVAHGATDEVRRVIAARYLPAEAVEQFVAMTPASELVTVSMTPERWRSSDFGKLSGPPA